MRKEKEWDKRTLDNETKLWRGQEDKGFKWVKMSKK